MFSFLFGSERREPLPIYPVLAPQSSVREVIPEIPPGMVPGVARSGGGGAGPVSFGLRPGHNIARQFIPPFVSVAPIGPVPLVTQRKYDALDELEKADIVPGRPASTRKALLALRDELIHNNVRRTVRKYDIPLFVTAGYRAQDAYPQMGSSRKDHMLFIPTEDLEEFDPLYPPILTHAVSIIDKGDHIEYYDPHGKPYDARHPSVNFHVANFAGTKPIKCNTEAIQGNIGACEAYTTLKQLHPEMSIKVFNHFIKTGAERVGLSKDKFVIDKVDQYAKEVRQFAKYPPSSFKNGGIVYGRKYNH